MYSGATVILIEHAWPHSAFGNNITRQISPQWWYFAIPAVHRAKDNLGLATVGSNVETYRGYLLLPPGTARSVERVQQIGLGRENPIRLSKTLVHFSPFPRRSRVFGHLGWSGGVGERGISPDTPNPEDLQF